MQTFQLTVGSDGRVEIPDTQPGQRVTCTVTPEPDAPERLTLATARTDEEREAVIAAIRANARRLQDLLKDEPPVSTDDLYGEDGLPA